MRVFNVVGLTSDMEICSWNLPADSEIQAIKLAEELFGLSELAVQREVTEKRILEDALAQLSELEDIRSKPHEELVSYTGLTTDEVAEVLTFVGLSHLINQKLVFTEE